MPQPTRSNRGGFLYHKQGCRCNACKGKTKANPLPDGGGGSTHAAESTALTQVDPAIEVIHADDPDKIFQARDLSKRGKVGTYVMMRAKGISVTEIASHLGISRTHLHKLVRQAVKEGWLVFDDPMARLEHEIAPKVIDNIAHFIDIKDRKMTIEAAKGLGYFQSHASVKVDGPPAMTVLAIKFEMPDGVMNPSGIVEGKIVGKPRAFDDPIDVKDDDSDF